MLIFIVLLLVPMLMQHAVIGNKCVDFEKKNKNALLFFFFFLVFLVMFRHESVGTDTRNYIRFFSNYSVMSWKAISKSAVELGFAYFNKVVSLFSDDPQFFLAVTVIVTVAMIYPTYRRLCVDTSLTIVLFCTMSTFSMMFSGIRQMLAIGIGFIAYEFTRKNKLILYIICVAIAITFHTSAVMLAVMYPLYHAKITKKWLFAVVPALVAVFAFNRPIFSYLSFLIERYTSYKGGITQTGAYTMLILFAIFAVFAFLIPDEALVDDETVGLRNFLLLALVVQMFAPLHHLAMRMSYYYIIFIPLLLPKVIAAKSEKWQQVAVVARHVMVAFFFGYFFINSAGGGDLDVFPYHFYWENI